MSHPLPNRSSRVSGNESAIIQINQAQGPGGAHTRSLCGLQHLIIASPKMIELVDLIETVGCSHVPVLITGETGTGKEMMARAVHELSERSHREFVAFNCAAVSREMIESQLFGHQRGSFTGALNDFKGIIRAVDGGTLLLDEIGELELSLQPKLLRFLQEGEVHPLGSAKPVRADVRIIAATNRDLEAEVKAGRFRADLFERLHVIRLHIPPLRERREEIPLLVQYFLERFKKEIGRTELFLSEQVYQILIDYHWPRNVRELANEVYRLVILAKNGEVIGADRLSPSIRQRDKLETFSGRSDSAPENQIIIDDSLSYAAAREYLEREMISRGLKRSNGNITQTAAALGMDRTGLAKAIKRLGLKNQITSGK
jgi:hydrogenase-4 transcriptional activator